MTHLEAVRAALLRHTGFYLLDLDLYPKISVAWFRRGDEHPLGVPFATHGMGLPDDKEAFARNIGRQVREAFDVAGRYHTLARGAV
jgi:hypothetical protein